MEIQQRFKGSVLAQVHQLGGNLIRIGEGLQRVAKRPALAGAAPAPSLTAALHEAPAEVYAPAQVEVEGNAPGEVEPTAAVEVNPDASAVLEVVAAAGEVSATEPGVAASEAAKPLNHKGKKSRRR